MQLIRFLFSISPARIVSIAAAGLVGGVANTWVLMLVTKALSPHAQLTVMGVAVPPVVAFAATALVALTGTVLSQLLLIRLTQHAIYQLRAQLSSGVVSVPLAKLERLGMHRLLATLTEDVQSLSQAVTTIPNMCIEVATIVGGFVWLAMVSRPIFAAMAAGTFLSIMGVQKLHRRVKRLYREARENEDALLRSFQSVTAGIKELKLHRSRRHDFMERHLLGTAGTLRDQNVAAGSRSSKAQAYGRAMQLVTMAGILFGLTQVIDLRGAVFTYMLITMFLQVPMLSLMPRIQDLLRGDVALAKIRDMSLSMQSNDDEEQLPYVDRPAVTQARLQLRNVGYTYQGELAPAVPQRPGGRPGGLPQNQPTGVVAGRSGFHIGPLDLVFEPGQITFIVGGNGSGKSTLAKLLTGLYVPETGSLALNGEKIDNDNIEWFRQNCSAIFTDFHLFEDYLGFDRPGIDDEVRYYLQELQLSHKVAVQDGRLSTIALSQGQRKRLALLTAMLEDRPIYLFDEWAADQDPHFREVFYTEILPGLKRRGKTLIVITHDDRYFHCADQLVKLDFGQIVDVDPPTPVGPAAGYVHEGRGDSRSLVGKCLLCDGSGANDPCGRLAAVAPRIHQGFTKTEIDT